MKLTTQRNIFLSTFLSLVLFSCIAANVMEKDLPVVTTALSTNLVRMCLDSSTTGNVNISVQNLVSVGLNYVEKALPTVTTALSTNLVRMVLDSSSTGNVMIAANNLATVMGVDPPIRSGTMIAIGNTTTETAIFTNTITANLLGTNKKCVITLEGILLNNTGGTSNFTAKVYLGTTKISECLVPNTTSATPRSYKLIVDIQNRESTSSQFGLASLLISTPNNPTTGLAGSLQIAGASQGPTTFSASENTTTNIPVSVTITPQHAVTTLTWTNYVALLQIQ